MKEENKDFFKQNIFIDRVQSAMAHRDMTYDQLCDVLNKKIKYTITKSNLKLYISDRTPNANFIIALGRGLGVSTDYLLGESNDGLPEGMNQRFYSKRYTKYIGKYKVYFYETVNGESGEIIVATLEITFTTKYVVTMKIITKEGGEKTYYGSLQISETYPNAFIILNSDFGEIVSMTFYDEAMNFETFRCAVGAMLSISCGDLKRAPVINRFIITDYEISEDRMKFVRAHLKLNTKYLNMRPENIDKSVESVLGVNEQSARVIERLKNAFGKKEYHSIEESFITNTIRKDEELTSYQADDLVAVMRNNSLGNVNFKINKSLDSVVFRCTNPDTFNEIQ